MMIQKVHARATDAAETTPPEVPLEQLERGICDWLAKTPGLVDPLGDRLERFFDHDLVVVR